MVYEIAIPLGVYLLSLLFITVKSRSGSSDDFLVAGRSVRSVPIAASLSAGLVGGGFLVFAVALAFTYGLGAFWFYIGIALGMISFLIFSRRVKHFSDKHEFITISDYLTKKFSFRVGFAGTLIIFMVYYALVFVQFIAGGNLLSLISGLSYVTCILLMGLFIMVYLLAGGLRAVIKTDIFQYVLMVFLSIFLIFFIKDAHISPAQLDIFSIGPVQIFAFTLLGIVAMLPAPDLWQRAIAAKDHSSARKGIILSSILLLIFGFVVSLIGIFVRNADPSVLPDNALYFGFMNLIPAWLLGVGLVVLFSSIMSTLDTCLFISALNVTRDVLHQYRFMSKRRLVRKTKIVIILLLAFAMMISLFVQDIISVITAIASLLITITPVVVASFYFRIHRNSAFLSILSGLITTSILFATGTLTPDSAVLSFPVALVVLIFVQSVYVVRKKS